MAKRLKGQEISLSMSDDVDGVVEGLDLIQSFEFEFMFDILQEGYLGETEDRFDEIYKGVSGSMTLHLDKGAWFDLTQKVQDRAQRRDGATDTVFTVTATFEFPDAVERRLVFEDIFFGALPGSFGGRDEYMECTVPWNCSRATRIS